jgi:poly(glycerol-phosphate) alpha-glucosyltransferase
MSLVILHVLESMNPDAGSVAVCLGGLHDALASRGLQSKSVASLADVTHALHGVDIVHIHGWGYELAHRIAALALRAGKPYVVSPHGSLTFGPHNRPTWKNRLRFVWRCRRLVREAACVIAINPQEEHDLKSRRIHPRIRLLPYGLSFDEYTGTPSGRGVHPSANRSLLMLGPLHPRGGCVALLKAIAEIGPDANGWNVVLAGKDNGEWRKMLESAVRRKKSEDRVTFAEACTVAQQRALLAGASLVASPGLHIGLSVSIMQAVASGVPVIASTCTAPPGLDCAIQVFAPRREELREALRSVLRIPDESRRAMGEKARTMGRAVFDWSVLADQYVQLYKSIA